MNVLGKSKILPSSLHDALTCMAKLGDPEKGRKTIIQKKIMNTI